MSAAIYEDQAGGRKSWVLTRRAGPWVEVRRQNPDGSLAWCTWHFTRRGARRAARLWAYKGETRGFKP